LYAEPGTEQPRSAQHSKTPIAGRSSKYRVMLYRLQHTHTQLQCWFYCACLEINAVNIHNCNFHHYWCRNKNSLYESFKQFQKKTAQKLATLTTFDPGKLLLRLLFY